MLRVLAEQFFSADYSDELLRRSFFCKRPSIDPLGSAHK